MSTWAQDSECGDIGDHVPNIWGRTAWVHIVPNYLTSLSLSFFVCKLGMLSLPCRGFVEIK